MLLFVYNSDCKIVSLITYDCAKHLYNECVLLIVHRHIDCTDIAYY